MLRSRRRSPCTTVLLTFLAITSTACGSDGNEEPGGQTSSTIPATTASTDPATATQTDPATMTVESAPTSFVGVTTGGKSSVVYALLDGTWVPQRTDASPSGAVATAVLVGSEVVVSTCCEPASGIRWSIGDSDREIGLGTTTDASTTSEVWVDVNAGAITLESGGAVHVLTSSSGQTPTDAALTPTGAVAVISFGDGDRYSVHVVDLTATEFDATEAIYETTRHLEAVSVAADGSVWVLEGDGDPTTADNVQIAIEPATGAAHPTGAEPLVDQTFDPSGVHLIVASAKGRVLLGGADERGLVDIGVSGIDRVDW